MTHRISVQQISQFYKEKGFRSIVLVAFRKILKDRYARKIFLQSCERCNSRFALASVYPSNYENLHIGSNVRVNNAYFNTQGDITIGDATFFGWGVKVLTGTHPIYERGIVRQKTISSKSVFIGAGVWVASYAIILPGSVIGDNCVVSAGSVVKGIFPADKLIAGNPARIIKSLDFGPDIKSDTNERPDSRQSFY